MKRYLSIIFLIITVFCIWSCEKTEMWLNGAGNPSDLEGVWVTSNYIEKTAYLANVANANKDITYRDTVTVDSTTLTFSFGAGRADSVQVTAVKKVKGLDQAPVRLPAGRWSFAMGITQGGEKPGLTYFNVYQTALPNNTVVSNSYGTIYTYRMVGATSMEIAWVVTSGTPQNTINYKALLIKQ